MPRLYVIMLLLFGTAFALATEPHFRLAPLFTDNMVLQQ